MTPNEHTNTTWLFEITPKNKFFSLNLAEVWQYRDLLFLFVKRDIVTVYKQTVLGPLWYFIQPLFTSLTFTIVFNNLAGISTGSVPPFLFNLASITVWNYFTACLTGTSNTFASNAGIFGKVYFPRIIAPLTVVLSNLIKFFIQLFIFICFFIYYYSQDASISTNSWTLCFPFVVVLLGVLGLGFGMMISSLVTKYRDLTYLIGFGVQLLMYISAVFFPLDLIAVKIPNYAWLVQYNPLAYCIEATRYMLLSTGSFPIWGMVYTLFFSLGVFLVGLLLFNHTEKKFIDTV
ncbi:MULTISPECIES: ABC transporter permease [unclassified Flavobacterium]|jgi:lipopolysaccharide transport system permease protein|uniref:ABC transporter permease n=1 Tax=unclassified Flavobacterium TaxID=196869 RepID=UPI00131B8357|nr:MULTISPECIES: ABC transporter permease [unclassified Flavobacterium]